MPCWAVNLKMALFIAVQYCEECFILQQCLGQGVYLTWISSTLLEGQFANEVEDWLKRLMKKINEKDLINLDITTSEIILNC